MLKSLFLAACIIGTAYTAAAVDDYLHIKTANGWVVFNLNNADRITFNNGKMTVLDQSGNTLGSINQSDLVKAHFSNTTESTSVNSIVAEDPTFSFDAASKTVKIDCDGTFEIFAIDGKTLISIPSAKKGETVNIESLNENIVIIKLGNYSIKTIVK
ncbi:MAG: hypothetical protein OSJ37_01865 [Muribaculaceae bacterium]|jgi:hypothetical protein|nr:hypothetical protein [Muribaculaceae bacterium]